MIVSTVSEDTLADSAYSWRSLEKVSISSQRVVKLSCTKESMASVACTASARDP